MGAVDSARESDYAAARIHIPIGRAESRERGDKIYAVGIGHALGELVAAFGVVYHMQLIAQPLDNRACVERGALYGIFDLVADTPRDAGEQVVLRLDALLTRVHQQEAAGAVGVLRLTGLKAGLTEQSRRLIAYCARNRNTLETLKADYAARNLAVDHA